LILEHEIPQGSKIYFGEIAKKKREIERIASEILDAKGFTEIVTPIFSYHQTHSIEPQKLIYLTDNKNYPMTLRADNTVDVGKISLKRLGNSEGRWFYIQPTYRYPSKEKYEIGAEQIGSNDLLDVLKVDLEIIEKIGINPILQIANVEVPRKIALDLGLDISIFKNIEIRKILDLKIDWLEKLFYLETLEELEEVLKIVPEYLIEPLEKIGNTAKGVKYNKTILSPLYYTKMEYYNHLFFRIFENNRVYSRGGCYLIEGIESVGFGLFTDEVLKTYEEN
jgi:histidyl-tRNA synthetase